MAYATTAATPAKSRLFFAVRPPHHREIASPHESALGTAVNAQRQLALRPCVLHVATAALYVVAGSGVGRRRAFRRDYAAEEIALRSGLYRWWRLGHRPVRDVGAGCGLGRG
jgi:hypothetical protein